MLLLWTFSEILAQSLFLDAIQCQLRACIRKACNFFPLNLTLWLTVDLYTLCTGTFYRSRATYAQSRLQCRRLVHSEVWNSPTRVCSRVGKLEILDRRWRQTSQEMWRIGRHRYQQTCKSIKQLKPNRRWQLSWDHCRKECLLHQSKSEMKMVGSKVKGR